MWQYHLRGGIKIIEYLLILKVETNDYMECEEDMAMVKEDDAGMEDADTPLVHTIKIQPIKESNLPRRALKKLQEILASTGGHKAQRAEIQGELRLQNFELGQTCLSLAATLEAANEEQQQHLSEQLLTKLVTKAITPKNVASTADSSTVEREVSGSNKSSPTNITAKILDTPSMLAATHGWVREVEKQFHRPDIIDSCF